jgi:hypothetical protein
MTTGSWMNEGERTRAAERNRPIGWSRANINKSIARIRACFRCAVLEKLIPANVVTDLGCLPPLRFGRGGARESPTVTPVAVADVEATITHLPPVVADMVRVQLLTGCRPANFATRAWRNSIGRRPSGSSGPAGTRRNIAGSHESSP